MLKIYLNLAYIHKGLQGQLSHLLVKIWQNLTKLRNYYFYNMVCIVNI